MQTRIGLMLLLCLIGEGLGQAEPIEDCQTKAAQGDVVEQTNLGLRYLAGQGVPPDNQQALL
jgi:hypothetical protein